MPSLNEMVESRLKLITDMRGLYNDAKDGVLNTEQEVSYKKMEEDEEKLSVNIERQLKLEKTEKSLNSSVDSKIPGNATSGDSDKVEDEKRSKVHKRAMEAYIKEGVAGLNKEEFRALNAGLLTEGGSFVPPTEFSSSLIKFVDDQVVMRGLATKFTVSKSGSLGFPTWEADPADADWTTELLTGSLDTAMATGLREFKPSPMAKLVKVSRTLLRKSVIPVESLIRERLGYKFGITQEKAFLTGTGAGQPLGVFTASDYGIPTSRDISTDMTTTDVTGDALIECFFNVKAQYQAVGSWLAHRSFIKKIRKLKDGNGNYLWEASIKAGTPDTILNRPVIQSEYAPSTFTTGLYAALFGDFSKYYIVDDIGTLEIQKLVELYAATNQDGFIGRMECDGMPVLAEAWSRLKFA